jgi:hypothetical protein
MTVPPYLNELRDEWFPHITDAGLNRVIELLEKNSPLLIHGAFTRAVPMGCLATHIAWHHPQTCRWTVEAGIMWLSRVAGLNPATSKLIRVWDSAGQHDLDLRSSLLAAFKSERDRRQSRTPAMPRVLESSECRLVSTNTRYECLQSTPSNEN